MIIPHSLLEQETLCRLIEEYVSREGTDNGYDQDLASRVAQVRTALETGEAVIVFDSDSQSANIVLAQALKDTCRPPSQ